MLAIIAYGTAFLGTVVTFALVWWLYRHDRSPPAITAESVAALVDEQYPEYAPDALSIAEDGACALLIGGRDGEAIVLPVGRHLVFWRLSEGTFARALAESRGDEPLLIRSGDLTRPRIIFRRPADFHDFAARVPRTAAATNEYAPQQEFAA